MTTEVELPDGTILDVETDDPQAAASAAKAYLSKQSVATPAAALPSPTPMGQRFLQGVKDVSLGTEQLVAHGARRLGLSETWAPAVDKRLAELKQQYVAPEGIDWMRMGGQTFATLPLGLIGPAGAGIGRGIVAGAIGGGLAGATAPVEDTSQGYAGQKAMQTGLGAATGGVIGGLGGLIGKAIYPKVDPNATKLINEGISVTPGQILGGAWRINEGKAESFPVLGDMIKDTKVRGVESLNRAMLNRALEPIGEKSTQPLGGLALQEVQNKLSGEFKNLLPRITFTPDEQFANDLRSTIDGAHSTFADPEKEAFNRVLKNKLFSHMGQGGAMSGERMDKVMSELKSVAEGYKSDPSFDQRQLGGAIDEVQNLMMSSLVRQNPEEAGQLSRVNEGWANFAVARNATGRIGAKEGIASPGNLLSAVRAQDKTRYKSRFAIDRSALMQDLAEPAASVMGEAYPNSGTPGRMMLGALAGLGANAFGYISPHTLLAGALAVAPYTKTGQKVVTAALTRRPSGAPATRTAVEKLNPYLGMSAERLREELTR